MRSAFGNSVAVAREIGGHFVAGQDRIVQSVVASVCRACWPDNTDAHVGTICGCSTRNARRIMSGEVAVPPELLVAVQLRMLRKFE